MAKPSHTWVRLRGKAKLSSGLSANVDNACRKCLVLLSLFRCSWPEDCSPWELILLKLVKFIQLVSCISQTLPPCLSVITLSSCPDVYNKHTELLGCCSFSTREPVGSISVFLTLHLSSLHSLTVSSQVNSLEP